MTPNIFCNQINMGIKEGCIYGYTGRNVDRDFYKMLQKSCKQKTLTKVQKKKYKKPKVVLQYCSARHVRIFYRTPRRIRSGQKDKEKEEYGLLCVVICCEQPPPHLSPHLAHHFTCLRPGLSGLQEQGRAAPPPAPLPLWTV